MNALLIIFLFSLSILLIGFFSCLFITLIDTAIENDRYYQEALKFNPKQPEIESEQDAPFFVDFN